MRTGMKNPPIKLPSLPADQLGRMRTSLLEWYDRERRTMPWREHPSPYRTVVSEFMLQQTQVAAVIPYFEKFVRRFKDFRSLARAAESDVLAQWSGLGYYRRARLLKRTAETLVRDYQGNLPANAEALRQLPGFGEYTTAAVGSIARGLPLAAVDGNVRRVLARLFTVSSSGETGRIARWADALLDPARPGDWNQAMMELGATVCLPRNPRCLICPVQSGCRAFKLGRAEDFPKSRPSPSVVSVREVAVGVKKRDRLLLLLRGEDGPFAGMWELPRMDSRQVETETLTPKHVLFETARLRGGAFSLVGKSESTFTRHKIKTTLYQVERVADGAVRMQNHVAHRWVKVSEIGRLPISKAQRRLIELILAKCDSL